VISPALLDIRDTPPAARNGRAGGFSEAPRPPSYLLGVLQNYGVPLSRLLDTLVYAAPMSLLGHLPCAPRERWHRRNPLVFYRGEEHGTAPLLPRTPYTLPKTAVPQWALGSRRVLHLPQCPCKPIRRPSDRYRRPPPVAAAPRRGLSYLGQRALLRLAEQGDKQILSPTDKESSPPQTYLVTYWAATPPPSMTGYPPIKLKASK